MGPFASLRVTSLSYSCCHVPSTTSPSTTHVPAIRSVTYSPT